MAPSKSRWKKPGEDVKLAEIQQESLELRKQGLTYEQIGKRQGTGKRTAHKRVMRAIAKMVDEPAADVLKLEIARLDIAHNRQERSIERLEALIAKYAKSKVLDIETAELLVKAEQALSRVQAGQTRTGESRRKLLGLDAPDKHEHTGKGGGPIDVRDLTHEQLAELADGRWPAPAGDTGGGGARTAPSLGSGSAAGSGADADAALVAADAPGPGHPAH